MTTTTPNSLPPVDQQRLYGAADNWKRKLLDLTKRNRSLNFKTQSVSTVTIIEELPSAIFTKIWIEGVSMRFAVTETAEPSPAPGEGDIIDELLLGEGQSPTKNAQQIGLLAAPPKPESVDGSPLYSEADRQKRYYDNILQTSASREKLDKSLRRLADQARLTIEEQGVNPLFLTLGMLYYKESPDSKEVFRAPIILLPVDLSRKSAGIGYGVGASGDDPMVNPALVEYLRRSFGVVLPELPDAASMGEAYDLGALLAGVQEAVKAFKDWTVKDEIYLGLFSFQKFVMYKDIEQNAGALTSHRLIRQLILRAGKQYSGLPAEVQSMDLDRDFVPEKTFQVVDADSSQLRAIAAVARSHDLVLEGPPGTGKSQTITNLIAQALADGKSVLFVAEKNAALRVVYQRLVSAGLGDFCMELHSSKANKRAVIHELARSLDASLQRPTVSTIASQRLPVVRERLTEYVRLLHQPFGALNISPYQAFGRFGAVASAPRLKYVGPVDMVSENQLSQTLRDLNELAGAAAPIGDPRTHPWRNTSRTFYTEDDLDTVRDLCQQLLAQLATIARLGNQLEARLGLRPIQTCAELSDFLTVTDVIARSPGAPPEILTSELWSKSAPPEVLGIIHRGSELRNRLQAIEKIFKPNVYDSDHSADIAYMEKKARGLFGILAILDSNYRQIRLRWLEYRLPTYQGSIQRQAEQLKHVDQVNQDRKWLAEIEGVGRQYFGNHWRGEESDWNGLEKYVKWVVEFHHIRQQYSLGQNAINTVQSPAPDLSDAVQLREAVAKVTDLLKSLEAAVGWPENYFADANFVEIENRVRSMVENLGQAHPWAAFRVALMRATGGLASDLIRQGMENGVAFADLAAAFQRAFYQRWLITVLEARKPLVEFNTLLHEQRITEFKQLDKNVFAENKASLISRLRDEVQRKLQTEEVMQAMPFLRKEMARQRGLSPLRRTFKQAGAAIRAIKPCFMMSPLTVAQLLDGSQPSFDLVIFDEASQLPAEDAVGAIIRGRQLAVVGDPKQLPPTNFFAVMSGQVSTSVDEDGMPLYEDGESILEEFLGAGVPACRLKWHYRSAHESLIHFSNISFYDGELYTFPCVESGSNELGMKFEYVENGVYEGKGLNLIEARRVVNAVVEHAKSSPDLSLGVGTFNLRQQLAIQDEVERRRRLDPGLDEFFSGSKEERFFVKNLENIQGDERDVIFISITYGKGTDGRLRYNFGPLNSENGWRRLNVLVSRARRRMKVFSSIRADDINPVGLTSAGARLLRDFLMYAESGRFERTELAKAAETESPFEQDVYIELTRRGISIAPQVGVTGYRIDLGVLDDSLPGRFICGLECDGIAYHTSETARDRDRLRQEVLEARGWTIYRIWSTDWFKDRQGQITRILGLIQEARERVKSNKIASVATHDVDAPEQDVGIPELNQSELEKNPVGGNRANLDGYIPPDVPAYHFAEDKGYGRSGDILEVQLELLTRAVIDVAANEGPIHIDELTGRIAGYWSTKPGKRIAARIRQAFNIAKLQNLITKQGDFIFDKAGTVQVRSRKGIRFPPNRIAPEEYREAVLLLLRTNHAFPRTMLITETRTLLGFGRTTPTLENLIGQAIDDLLSRGIAGESSNGITLRQ